MFDGPGSKSKGPRHCFSIQRGTMAKSTRLHDLDNDSLALILEFLDFKSFSQFAKDLSHLWRKRCEVVLAESHVQDRMFRRHGFSPEDSTSTANAKDCELRRKLDHSICPPPSRSRTDSAKLLRQDCFSFVPVLPDDWDLAFDDDPPPVSFDCDSFWLCSSGSSGELLYLNPFSTRLSVWDNVLNHKITSEISPSKSDDILEWKPCSPKQVLFDTVDYFEVDIHQYFPHHDMRIPRAARSDEDQEFHVSYIGIEAKPILVRDKLQRIKSAGTMAAVGRVISREEDFHAEANNHQGIHRLENNFGEHRVWNTVTELLAWFRPNDNTGFTDQHICRIRDGFRKIEVCAVKRCAYINRWATDSGLHAMAGQDRILVYPMILKSQLPPNCETSNFKFFPGPITTLQCSDSLTSLQVSSCGNWLVLGTTRGDIQIWNVRNLSSPVLVHKVPCSKGSSINNRTDEGESFGIPDEHWTNQQSSAVEEIYLSRHLPIDSAGFVTMMHSSMHGTTLFLWKLVDNEWKVRALVDLPLSSRHFPKVHFDGRKIIVLGRDHVGFLLLVYQILYCNEDLENFASGPSDSRGVASSVGVLNLDSTPALRFARKIRHPALGGLEPHDSLNMTCNERFIIVATKTGNYFESHLFSEDESDDSMIHCLNQGMLVINLLSG